MTLADPFQVRIFHDSMILPSSGYHWSSDIQDSTEQLYIDLLASPLLHLQFCEYETHLTAKVERA